MTNEPDSNHHFDDEACECADLPDIQELFLSSCNKLGAAYGDVALKCLNDRTIANKYLYNDDPMCVSIALQTFNITWSTDNSINMRAMAIIKSTDSLEAILAGLTVLGANKDKADAKNIVDFLLRLVETATEQSVRCKAYLVIIHQASIMLHIITDSCIEYVKLWATNPSGSFEFDVDIEFVNRLRSVLGMQMEKGSERG